MGLFESGELVVIPFPYSDLSNSKLRPALILVDLNNDDFIMVQVTSKRYDDIYSIKLSNEDLEDGFLKFDSFIKYSKIFTSNSNIIIKKIGKLKDIKYDEVINELIKLLKAKTENI